MSDRLLDVVEYLRLQLDRYKGAACFPVLLHPDEAQLIIKALEEKH